MQVDFLHIREALAAFSSATTVQDQGHIKPLHRHLAMRLVLEGGFLPDEITPHPPLRTKRSSHGWVLSYDPDAETTSELTVLGGMKTKRIDVVVAKDGIGPVVAISVKGSFRAYRNLVNRMEEAIGDSTNIHVMYPGLVYGFLHVLRANREANGYDRKDFAISEDGSISSSVMQYHAALSEMTGRRLVRNDYTRYESVALTVVENHPPHVVGSVSDAFPERDSPLRIELFFSRLFSVYDLRFPARADRLRIARRVAWYAESSFFQDLCRDTDRPLAEILGYCPRLSD